MSRLPRFWLRLPDIRIYRDDSGQGLSQWETTLQCTVECRYNTVQCIMILIMALQWQQRNLKSYLALTGELWGVYCKDLWENWPRCKDTILHLSSFITLGWAHTQNDPWYTATKQPSGFPQLLTDHWYVDMHWDYGKVNEFHENHFV